MRGMSPNLVLHLALPRMSTSISLDHREMATPHLLLPSVWPPTLAPKCLSKQWGMLQPRGNKSTVLLSVRVKPGQPVAYRWPRQAPGHLGSRRPQKKKITISIVLEIAKNLLMTPQKSSLENGLDNTGPRAPTPGLASLLLGVGGIRVRVHC